MNLLDAVEFTVTVKGDRTGHTYLGQFSALKRLSHRQELMMDRIRRDLLGANPEGATNRAKEQAEIFAELKVSITKAPSWWMESDSGLDLADDNVVAEVWENVLRVKAEAIKEIEVKAKEAEDKLKAALVTPEKK